MKTKKTLNWSKIITINLALILGSLYLYQNEFKETEILLKNSTYNVFSNLNEKDKFTISLIGKNILDGEIVFKIIDYKGNQIFNEKYPSSDLINQFALGDNPSDKELEESIKKRISEFFIDDNFSNPAINTDFSFDSDNSEKNIWNDIKSDSTAIGFYYLIGLENGCRIAYSKKQKKVLKYFCCC